MRIGGLYAYSNSGFSSINRKFSHLFRGSLDRKFITALPSPATSRNSHLRVNCAVRFRPCIDIHKGKVKQIVGSTLRDSKEDGSLVTNFESDKSAAVYANLYKEDGLTGGHVIMLGADPLSKAAALEALNAFPGSWDYIRASVHLFNPGTFFGQTLAIDIPFFSCHLGLYCFHLQEGKYAIVTDRWQKFTDVYLDDKILDFLANYADEFLVHGVDVEGKKLGIDEELVKLLGRHSPIPVTYAGGVTTMADLERIKLAGSGHVDVTVGSALDIFGGNLAYKDVVLWHSKQEALTV
ncbi:1-(5-phosphoribosyl)-5-[(5-phosphoribosylamino)methylideneamino] imidazole-4-carboxamide isomerase, chloroplastic [Carica papaya]|uniref:1-(5-phosphoribosyl)-5-[(5- phosphoribosylamino)methylideneamino] imidazole-4-carboxamide isomerase, chloroplastic n=1 Tax=Carica papaya TaxID=3649 RepID=UPI000B8CB0F4|nr:1-(5-phosphoribosyl)-5-[(5-phosphoribosylamino)methylideneamino] imidazole-4-carboxamide isomerase, chloroplastic [Carica papaya]